jgi:hypothetical protein
LLSSSFTYDNAQIEHAWRTNIWAFFKTRAVQKNDMSRPIKWAYFFSRRAGNHIAKNQTRPKYHNARYYSSEKNQSYTHQILSSAGKQTTKAPVLLVFEIFENCIFMFQKIIKKYFMNAYICDMS